MVNMGYSGENNRIKRKKFLTYRTVFTKKIKIRVKRVYGAPNTRLIKTEERRRPVKAEWLLKIFAGMICGFINGLFGGGGGMIVVPFLKNLLHYETERAHATTIAVILPLAIVSGAFYTAFGDIRWDTTLFVTLGAIFGGILGAGLLKRLKAKPLTVIFSLTMAAAGIKMLFF